MSILSTIPGSGSSSNVFGSVVPWLLVLMGLVVVGGVVISLIRRWMRGGDDAVQIGFSLSDLRAMHAEGRISSEELARAEERLIQQVRGNLTEEDLRRRAEIQNARTTGPSSPTARPSEGDLPE
ncbi:MAG: hypothetical protein VXY94_02295 [Planctomycetota bacterium]|nr:hypothetical protein [Planctomycetota bacterium]MEC9156538.1 hypothetical protein [Planctomycetota bacterium]MED5507980.1 hypothetical protein [Planctomycetota bacterium]